MSAPEPPDEAVPPDLNEDGAGETSVLCALEQTCTELAASIAQSVALCGLVGGAGSGKTSVLRSIAAASARKAAIRYPGQHLDPATKVDLLDDVGEDALTRLAATPAFRGVRVLAMQPAALHRFVDLFPDARIVRVRPMTTDDTLAMAGAYARRHALGDEALAVSAAGMLEAYAAGNPFRLGQLLREAHAVATERACAQITADHVDKAARKLGLASGPRGIDAPRRPQARQAAAARPRVAPAVRRSRGPALARFAAVGAIAALTVSGAYILGGGKRVAGPDASLHGEIDTADPAVPAAVPTPEAEATRTVVPPLPRADAVPGVGTSPPAPMMWPAGAVTAEMPGPGGGPDPAGGAAAGSPSFFVYAGLNAEGAGTTAADPAPPTAPDASTGQPAPNPASTEPADAAPAVGTSRPVLVMWPAGTAVAEVPEPGGGPNPVGDAAAGSPSFLIYSDPDTGGAVTTAAGPVPPAAPDAGIGPAAPRLAGTERADADPAVGTPPPAPVMWPAGTVVAEAPEPGGRPNPVGDAAAGSPSFLIYADPDAGDSVTAATGPAPSTAPDAGIGRPAPDPATTAMTEPPPKPAESHPAMPDPGPPQPAPPPAPAGPTALNDPAARAFGEAAAVIAVPDAGKDPNKAARLLGLGKVLLSIGQTKDALGILHASADLGSTEAAALAAAASASPTASGQPGARRRPASQARPAGNPRTR